MKFETRSRPRRLADAPVKEDRSVSACQHPGRDFTPHEEACETGHFPDLPIVPGCCFRDRETYICPDIEDRDLKAGDVAFDAVNQSHHLVLVARICRQCDGRAAAVAYGLRQGFKRICVSRRPHQTDNQTFPGKCPRNGGTGVIPGPNDQTRLFLWHNLFPPGFPGRALWSRHPVSFRD
jgi:hypothetical protein